MLRHLSFVGLALIWLASPGVAYAQGIPAGKAKLTLFDEYGMPHSAVRIEKSDGTVLWLGFMPNKILTPVIPGYVDTSDRSSKMRNYVTFLIDEHLIGEIEAMANANYGSHWYVLFKRTCVHFAADVARVCNLDTRPLNYLPGRFTRYQVNHNAYIEKGTYLK